MRGDAAVESIDETENLQTPAYTISLVPTTHCRQAWKGVKKHLAAAIELSHGKWEPEYVLAALVLNEQQLWVAINPNGHVDGACTTQVVRYPEKAVLMVHFLGGEYFADWYGLMLKYVADFAREAGCVSIECIARQGFWPWFKKDGFERSAIYYEKPL